MLNSIYSLVGPLAVFGGLQGFLTPDFFIKLFTRLGSAVLILIAARLAVVISRRLIIRAIAAATARSGKSSRRLITLQSLLFSTVSYLIYFITALLVLFALGVPPGTLAPLLGAASVLGLAIGFGAQRLIRDVITGLFILGEGQFDVGEWVTIGTVTGSVEDIGLRVTRLRDDQGRLYIIANGDITQVFNASRALVKLTIDISLQRSSLLTDNLDVIRTVADDILKEFCVNLTNEWEHPSLTLVDMDSAKVTVRLVLWSPVHKNDAIEDAVRRRLLDLIDSSECKLELA